MARPSKLNEETQDLICTALQIGASYKDAANYAGVTYETFNNWRNAGLAVLERLEQELAKETAAKEAGEEYKPNFKTTPDERLYLQFFQAVEQADAAGRVAHLNFLYQQAPHDPKVSMWILERRNPDDYGPAPKRIEHSGRDGGAIETRDVSDIPYEERAARILALFDAARQRQADDSPPDTAGDS